MWLFYADSTGWIPMGNDGAMQVSARSERAVKQLAESWLGKRRGRIYRMREWTQEMCELGPAAFERYIQTHGEVVAHS